MISGAISRDARGIERRVLETGYRLRPAPSVIPSGELNDVVDDVAERARTLGGRAFGSLSEFVQHTRLKERVPKPLTARDTLAELAADHEAVIRGLHTDLVACGEQHGDAGTNDFLTGLMERHEKMAWMLRACLEARSA